MEGYEDIDFTFLPTTIYDGVGFYSVPAISYNGNFWLAPNWKFCPDESFIAPLRIIALDNFSYLDLRGKNFAVEFVVRDMIPQAVLYGPIDKQLSCYKLIDQPKMRTPNRGRLLG